MELRFAPNVIGHQKVKDVLGRLISIDQLHPSLILSGDDGIGKRYLAVQLAMALNCLEDNPKPCGHCSQCVKAIAGTHPDLTIVEPTDGRRAVNIEQVRNMIADMGRKPFEGKRRVFILSQADRLREDAMNTLLKSLEEPPGTTVTVLLTSRPSMLIETIHSRCQHLRLNSLNEDDVVAVLKTQGIDEHEARERAQFGAGSPGQAMSDEARSRADESLLLFKALVDGQGLRDPMGVAADLLSTLESNRTGIGQFCEWVLRVLRDLLVYTSTGEAPPAPMAPFAARSVKDLGPHVSLMNIRKAMDIVEKTQAGMDRNLNIKLEMEGLVIALATQLRVQRKRS
ncbi:MAG: DNA polymerase III subunit delta' [Planctomycetota bacterium]|nr:DNA polymerase III subunit delta' [Planctomycetota bacterium]